MYSNPSPWRAVSRSNLCRIVWSSSGWSARLILCILIGLLTTDGFGFTRHIVISGFSRSRVVWQTICWEFVKNLLDDFVSISGNCSSKLTWRSTLMLRMMTGGTFISSDDFRKPASSESKNRKIRSIDSEEHPCIIYSVAFYKKNCADENYVQTENTFFVNAPCRPLGALHYDSISLVQ